MTPDASTEAPSLPPGAHRVGETWTLGECTYTVARVESAERVGDRYLNETAASGAVFVLARYTERNNSSETITASSDNVVLRDPQGRSFRPSSRVQVMLQADLLPELQPGVQHDHRVGFEVPVDVIRAPFDLIFTERGLLGSDTAQVRVIPAANPPPPAPSQVMEAPSRRHHHRH